jgi:hypothetical protein
MKPEKFLRLLTALLFVLYFKLNAQSQVNVTYGPELGDNDKAFINNMIDGENTSFYNYRVRYKGKGTSYIIQKIDKKTLSQDFKVDMEIPDIDTKVIDVHYSSGNVYVFFRQYNKEMGVMSLNYKMVSSSGKVLPDVKKILDVKSNHYQFVHMEVKENPSRTKFLVKVTHKAFKEDTYKTDFILLNSVTMEIVFKKTINRVLNQFNISNYNINAYRFCGIDDMDNIYYCFLERPADTTAKGHQIKVGIIGSTEEQSSEINLDFDYSNIFKDFQFINTNNKIIVVGYFLEHIKRTGRDKLNQGLFSFTINLTTQKVESRTIKMLDEQMLATSESSLNKGGDYRMDYVFTSGENTYFVGEQYLKGGIIKTNASGSVSMMYTYTYLDVIVGKLNGRGEFEWIKSVPMKTKLTTTIPHHFKPYCAILNKDNIYILRNSDPKNLKIINSSTYKASDLKRTYENPGSSFIYSTVNINDGLLKHGLIFENIKYCFAPIQIKDINFYPSRNSDVIFGANNEVYFFTQDYKGKECFDKLVLQ